MDVAETLVAMKAMDSRRYLAYDAEMLDPSPNYLVVETRAYRSRRWKRQHPVDPVSS
jgi:hypothetical protein